MLPDANPYPGPRPLVKGESIFGRHREKYELFYLLNSRRIVLLVSPSGAGKTSLLQAGLIPLLCEHDFHVLPPVRVAAPLPDGLPEGTNRFTLSVMESLEPPDHSREPAELARLSLLDYFSTRASTPGAPPSQVLIFDQFEEVLTQDRQDIAAKERFFSELGDLLRDSPIWAVFAIREEYLAALDPYSASVPTRFMHRFWLELLDLASAKLAIEGPAKEHNVSYAEGFADDLVKRLALGGSFVEPVQLQAVCHRLWPERDGSNRISLPESRRSSIVDSALRDYYNDSLDRVCGQSLAVERQVREWIGERLISSSGARELVPVASVGPDITPTLLEDLKLTFLIREEPRPRGAWIELAHDTLIKPVLASNEEWWNTHLSPQQKRARLWDRNGRADNLLSVSHAFWRGHSRPYEADYAGACRSKAARFAGVAALIVVLIFVLWRLRQQQVETERQKKINQSREFAAAAEGEALTDNSKELAIWLALRALDSTDPPLPQAEEALHHAVQAKLERYLLNGEDQLTSLAFYAPDGLAATGSLDGNAYFWKPVRWIPSGWEIDQKMFQEPVQLPHGAKVYSVSFSHDGKTLASAGEGGVKIWPVPPPESPDPLQQLPPAVTIKSVAYGPKGKWLAAGDTDGQVHLWALPDYKPLKPLGLGTTKSAANQIAFSPDGTLLAAVFNDGAGTTKIWRTETWEEVPSNFPSGLNDSLAAIAFHPNSAEVAIGHANGRVDVWDIGGKQPRYHFIVPGTLKSLAYSSDGQTILTAGDGSQGRAWRNGTLHLVLDRGDEGRDLAAVVPAPGPNRVAFVQAGSWGVVQEDQQDQKDQQKQKKLVLSGGVRFYDLDLNAAKNRSWKLLANWDDCPAKRKYDPAAACKQ